MQSLAQIFEKAPYIPVVSLESAAAALPLAQALIAGGVNIVEFTLRSETAVESIAHVREKLQDFPIGAGTVLNGPQARAAIEAGASFLVSPGFSQEVWEVCQELKAPYLPGAVTPSEIQRLQSLGFEHLKFFPAEASGGIPMLRALAPVFPRVKFCATGGVTLKNAVTYLEEPNVICVGMSALTPQEVVASSRWDEVTRLAESLQLR